MIDEHQLEQQTLAWFAELGYEAVHGPDIAPESANPERVSYQDSMLIQRLRNALHRLNPVIPAPAIEDALCQLQRPESPSLTQTNCRFHRWLLDGVPVEYRCDNRIIGDSVRLVDFVNLANNDWQMVNQLTIKDSRHTRRPDLVVFLNGLPIAVIELKNPADEHADIWKAFNQLQTYKDLIPDLFNTNELLVISDGIEARVGSLTATREWFMPWRTVDGKKSPANMSALEVLVRGLFAPERLLDYLRYFVLFEQNGDMMIRKIAAYHQFHAVRAAVSNTVTATAPRGDHRCGVVWHAQGPGKSLTMAFLAAKLIAQRVMRNPTLASSDHRPQRLG